MSARLITLPNFLVQPSLTSTATCLVRMSFTNPRRTSRTTSSAMTPSSTGTVATNIVLRKGATFNSSSSLLSEHHFNVPSLPRRSETTLEDVIEAHKRRIAVTLGDIDRGLSAVDLSSSPTRKSYRDDSFPVPQGFLNHTVTAAHPRRSNNSMTDTVTPEVSSYNTSGRSLPSRRQDRRKYYTSDNDSDNSSAMSGSEQDSLSTGLTSISDDDYGKPNIVASAITRSAATQPSTLESLPRLSMRASNKIREHILKPLLAKSSLKDFHPILEDCPRRIHAKEIVCLRDLEKTLIFMAPVSGSQPNEYVGDLAHWFSSCLKEKSKTIGLYLDFCLTSIRCIQATVEFVHEREQTRLTDRPYTNGYFIDLVDQIKNYAQQMHASKEKEKKGESLGEMDPEPYVFQSHLLQMTTSLPSYCDVIQPSTSLCEQTCRLIANPLLNRTDEVKLYGGLTRNGRPAELVRIKKNGKAISIATGQPVELESIEDDEKGGVMMKRSLSAQEEDDESIMRSMARRKRSASAQEPAPKVCREPNCKKEFKRSCDLTKHEKTHSRPWKCSDKACKYHEYGWPTEKELDRHVNDKHSTSPILYQCQFTGCPYKSKRDSNCKQHMEKAHGWNYVRSKNNGKTRSKAGSATLPTPQTMNHRTPDSNEPGPEDEDQELAYENFGSATVGFDTNVFDNEDAFPEYPTDDFMQDIHMQGFISPADTNADPSSSDSTPFMGTDHDLFTSNNIQANFGENFANGGDFPLFGDDDIYNARVELPPTPDLQLYHQPIDAFISSLNAQSAPQISPLGQGNHMLYTPVSLVEDNFTYSPQDQQLGNDYQLFSTTHQTMLQGNSESGNLFGEVPSDVAGFSQNTQDFFQAFYNPINMGAGEWAQQDDGYNLMNQQ